MEVSWIRGEMTKLLRRIGRRTSNLARVIRSVIEEPTLNLSYGTMGEDLVLDRIIRKKLGLAKAYQGTYVDIGAFHPTRNSLTYPLYRRGWSGLAIDFSETFQDRFKRMRPRDTTLCVAVGERKETRTAYIKGDENHQGNTIDERATQRFPPDTKLTERPVQVVPAETILDEQGWDGRRIDFLNIDVEGHELEVLRGMNLERFRPSCIAVEIHPVLTGLEDIQQALSGEVGQFLLSRGYVCVACCVITYFFVHKDAITCEAR